MRLANGGPKQLAQRAIVACLLAVLSAACTQGRPPQRQKADPWTAQQIVLPGELAKEMAQQPNARPTIVFVGFRTLFEGGHIPGALMHGPANSETSLAAFKEWVKSLDRASNIVIYCGCCPFVHCPNVRPAFAALESMGFKHLRVLKIENNFASDWAAHGYPTEKGL